MVNSVGVLNEAATVCPGSTWRESTTPVTGERMLALAEQIAVQRGSCKLTLEVLSGNGSAIKLYERIGFAGYQLDPAMGSALFLQKWL